MHADPRHKLSGLSTIQHTSVLQFEMVAGYMQAMAGLFDFESLVSLGMRLR